MSGDLVCIQFWFNLNIKFRFYNSRIVVLQNGRIMRRHRDIFGLLLVFLSDFIQTCMNILSPGQWVEFGNYWALYFQFHVILAGVFLDPRNIFLKRMSAKKDIFISTLPIFISQERLNELFWYFTSVPSYLWNTLLFYPVGIWGAVTTRPQAVTLTFLL